MLLALDGHFAGLIAVADPIKASTPEATLTRKQPSFQVGHRRVGLKGFWVNRRESTIERPPKLNCVYAERKDVIGASV